MPNESTELYDPNRTFDENFDSGPFPSGATEEQSVASGSPTYSFVGQQINSPFGIAAGPLPTSRHTTFAFQNGYDVVCYKTQRSTKFSSNKFPNIVYLDVDGDLTLEKAKQPIVGHLHTDSERTRLTITNSFGNPSRGPEFWQADLAKAVSAQGPGQLLIASVVGTIKDGFSEQDYFNDFASTASLAAATGVRAIEVNLSCPNVASEGVLCYSAQSVITICRLIKNKIGTIPLVAKLGYFSPEQEELLRTILSECNDYVAAYSAINTIPVAVVDDDGKQLLPGKGRLTSGACGAGIKWAGVDMVKRLSSLRDQLHLTYEIIGVGGVMSPQDFNEYRTAGADVVQTATGAMWNINLARQIKAAVYVNAPAM